MPGGWESSKDDPDELLVAHLRLSPWLKPYRRKRGTRMSKHTPGLADLPAEEIRRRVEAALSGDRIEMDRLIEDLAPVVHLRVAQAVMRRKRQARGRDMRQDLEDLMQEVFASLFAKEGKSLRQWDPDRGLSFPRFIGFLAEREVGMLMRTGKRNPWTEDPTSSDYLVFLSGFGADGVDRLESRDLLVRLAERLREQLTPLGRHYFQLLYVENQAVPDVAEKTGATTNSLYAWRSRILKLLRELRQELDSEERRNVR